MGIRVEEIRKTTDAPQTMFAHFEAYPQVYSALSVPIGETLNQIVKESLNSIVINAGFVEMEFLELNIQRKITKISEAERLPMAMSPAASMCFGAIGYILEHDSLSFGVNL